MHNVGCRVDVAALDLIGRLAAASMFRVFELHTCARSAECRGVTEAELNLSDKTVHPLLTDRFLALSTHVSFDPACCSDQPGPGSIT